MTNYERFKSLKEAREAFENETTNILSVHRGDIQKLYEYIIFLDWLDEIYDPNENCVSRIESKKVNTETCFMGYSDRSSCGGCVNGYCTKTVLASYPPQYQRCRFAPGGKMYEFCSNI